MLLVKLEKKYNPRFCGRPCAWQQEVKHTGGEQQWEKGNGNRLLVFRSHNLKCNQMTFLAASLTSPCPSTHSCKWCSLSSRTRSCVAIYNPKFSAEEMFTSPCVLLPYPESSCPVTEEKNAFQGAITHSPWMKYWRYPKASLPCCFKSSTNEPSFRKFCICACLCLLSQIQRLNVLTRVCFCAHRRIHGFLYHHNVKVVTSNTYAVKNYFPHTGFYLFKQTLEKRGLSFTQADTDSKEGLYIDRHLQTNIQ